MAFKTGLWMKIKHHLIYNRSELAKTLDINICSVTNWVHKHGLKPINEGEKISLFEGLDVIEFLKKWERERKVPLADNEFFCVKCKNAVTPVPASLKIEYTGKIYKKGWKNVIIHGNCKGCRGKIAKISSTKFLDKILMKIKKCDTR